MAVFVDNMRAKYGRMTMCHMIASTEAELLAMVDRIGVDRRWHQYPGTVRSHFDIALSKRALAVEQGAVEVTQKCVARIIAAKRSGKDPNRPMYFEYAEPVGRPSAMCCYKDEPCPTHRSAREKLLSDIIRVTAEWR